MDYIEFYKLCKKYTDFVEANMQSVQRINDVARCDTVEEFLEMHGDDCFNTDTDSMILIELAKNKNAIARPIQEEMIDTMQKIINLNDDICNGIHVAQEIHEDTSELEEIADEIVNDYLEKNSHLLEEDIADDSNTEWDARVALRSWRNGRK